VAENRLTAAQIARLKRPGRHSDGGGLYLRVAEYPIKAGGTARSKNWVFRWERDGRERLMGLGPLHTLSLADARMKARECRMAVLDGLDPIEVRRASRMRAQAAVARSMTFKACAQAYIKAHRAGWKNKKHANQWLATLETHVYPIIGQLSVAEIDTALVTKCLEQIWLSIPETAGRVRGRIESVLDWAKAHGHRDGDNPARWRGHLDKLLAKQSKVRRVRHHPALPYAELPAFMAELRNRQSISSRALEFTILTAARTSETIQARESEFDLDAKLWIVPGDRMKGTREHSVPLPDRAVEILKTVPRESGNELIFVGGRLKRKWHRHGAGLSDMAMLELLRGMRPGFTVHGFRSTFRDWAGDCTDYPREVIEAALAHAIGDETEAAYRRSTAIEKRRRLMADWEKYCAEPAPTDDTVVPLLQRRPSR
jgi:integrase